MFHLPFKLLERELGLYSVVRRAWIERCYKTVNLMGAPLS